MLTPARSALAFSTRGFRWLLVFLAASAAAEPAPGSTLRPVAATFKDLCPPKFITSGPYVSNHAYPTARTWHRDGRRVFVETSGPGPDGAVRKNARHLVMIDVETGRTEHLATTTSAKPEMFGCYLFDYAPDANCIVYQDLDGHALSLLNLENGKRGEILQEPEATLCGTPSIARDGTRVAYWATTPCAENRFFDNYITSIFALDLDPQACAAAGEPRIVDAYPRRKGKRWKDNAGDGIHVNHPQINPADRDHLCYSHEMRGSPPDGTPDRSRLWESRVDGGNRRPLVLQPAGLDFTHEVIAPDGKSLIFPYMHGIGQVFFDTLERRSLYYNPHCCPGHLTVSPDGQWIAGDVWGRWKDPQGVVRQTVMLIHVPSRQFANLCWIPFADGHPEHPHPNFSPDGKRIAFAMLDAQGVCQVAVVDISDAIRRWADVAEGTGEVASPKWR